MKKATKSKVIPKNVSLYKEQWDTIMLCAHMHCYHSTSAALRRIVVEWAEMQQGGDGKGDIVSLSSSEKKREISENT